MSFLNYLFLFAGVSVAMTLAVGVYFFITQYKTFFKVLEPFSTLKMPQYGLILTVGYLCAAVLFYFLCADKTPLNALNVQSVLLITVALGVVGLIPQTHAGYKILTVFMKIAACAGMTALFPKESVFFTLTALPYWGNFALCTAGVFGIFCLFDTFNKIDGFFLQQSCIFGVFFLSAAVFFGTFLLPESQLLILILTIFISGMWFYFAGVQISLTPSARNMLGFIYTALILFLLARHKIASAVLLGMYPLTECFIYAFRWFALPLRGKQPSFIYQDLSVKGMSLKQVMLFVFKRNCIFLLFAVMAVDAKLQYQPVLLGVIIAIDFYLRGNGSVENKPETLKGVFQQMKEDAKEDWSKSKDQIKQLKEKYAKNKEASADDK